jgi:D-tagatose-1,6-bisphosphate aldolase subunit GatZ/KbaZ
MTVEFLDEVVRAQKCGEARGVVSICSAHPTVLQTAVQRAVSTGSVLLVEATCNQVNQYGGYTGMTPSAFAAFVRDIASRYGLPPERLLLGGDHLGPSPWQDGPMERAMQRAGEMIRAYARAGFTKLHLDASMKLGNDDPRCPLDLELIARRTAWLARVAEGACSDLGPDCKPRYVIGTEVPTPGGATVHEDHIYATAVEDARRTLEATQSAFNQEGLGAAWERGIALVVQPGVEFGDDFVLDYDSEAGRDLAHFSETIPFVYEAHSTDYQTRENLRALVRDHFAVLKVGPALTYAFREAVFSLVMMESELVPASQRSRLIETLDDAMQRKPAHWNKHYRGTPEAQAFARKYSLSDRARYYWPEPSVQTALCRLLANLNSTPVPLTLLNQFVPLQYEHIRQGVIPNTPEAIIQDHILGVLMDYEFACGNETSA